MDSSSRRTAVNADGVVDWGLPYPHAVKFGNLVFLSGQLARDEATGQPVEGGIQPQTRKVLDLVRELRGRGIAVVYITHNMHDVMDVCDRCVVMKNGRKIGEVATSDVSREELANMIITGDMKPRAPALSRTST